MLKGSLYEGGIRVPLIVHWPGVTHPASVCKQYVTVEDYLPAILEMAGVKSYHTVQQTDSQIFMPYLKNSSKRDNNRSLIWNFPNNWTAENNSYVSWSCAIRKDAWKLLYSEKTGNLELYNIKNDIGEQNDLAAQYPQKVKTLAKELTKKLKQWNAQRPLYKSTGQPVPYPDEIANRLK